ATPGNVEIDHSVGQNDKVGAGSLSADIIHTPGHTEGSISLYFPLEKKLIAGDTLFAGSIGRTDLPGGTYKKIISSLHEKLLKVPRAKGAISNTPIGPFQTIVRAPEISSENASMVLGPISTAIMLSGIGWPLPIVRTTALASILSAAM